MYELFLTALVDDGDFDAACSVLTGLCGMSPWESIHRVLYFQGPPRPGGLPNLSAHLGKAVRKDTGILWKELHQSLIRSSFILQARYEVLKDRDFGPSAPPTDLNSTPGVLRWTDFPDPPRNQPLLTQRKKVEIWDQSNLPTILQSANYQ